MDVTAACGTLSPWDAQPAGRPACGRAQQTPAESECVLSPRRPAHDEPSPSATGRRKGVFCSCFGVLTRFPPEINEADSQKMCLNLGAFSEQFGLEVGTWGPGLQECLIPDT